MLQSAAIGGATKSKYTDLKKKQRVGMLKNAAIVGAMNSKYPDFFYKKNHTQRVGMLKSAAIVGTMKSKYAEAFGDPVGKVYNVCSVLCAVLLDAQCKSSVSCGV